MFLEILSPCEHALITLLEKFTDQFSLFLFTNTFLLILQNLKSGDILANPQEVFCARSAKFPGHGFY